MENEAVREAKSGHPKVVFNRVSENLYRLETSGGYYALVKRGGKQFRRSLKTKDRKLAERRLAEYQAQVGCLTISKDSRLSFDDIADRWMAATSHALKASTITRRRGCIKNLSPFFKGVTIRNIRTQHCEAWVTTRVTKIAAQTMAHELNTMRAVFDYAVRLGLMLTNPAKEIKRRKVIQAPIIIPTREQFRNLVAAIRQSDGRPDSQKKAKPGADLVELLAYSGCRLGEAVTLSPLQGSQSTLHFVRDFFWDERASVYRKGETFTGSKEFIGNLLNLHRCEIAVGNNFLSFHRFNELALPSDH